MKIFSIIFILFSKNLAEGSSDEDDGEEEEPMEEETQTTDKQCFENLQTFCTLGCELTDISKSVLSADNPVINLSASAVECSQLLKVCFDSSWHTICLMSNMSCSQDFIKFDFP